MMFGSRITMAIPGTVSNTESLPRSAGAAKSERESNHERNEKKED